MQLRTLSVFIFSQIFVPGWLLILIIMRIFFVFLAISLMLFSHEDFSLLKNINVIQRAKLEYKTFLGSIQPKSPNWVQSKLVLGCGLWVSIAHNLANAGLIWDNSALIRKTQNSQSKQQVRNTQ